MASVLMVARAAVSRVGKVEEGREEGGGEGEAEGARRRPAAAAAAAAAEVNF